MAVTSTLVRACVRRSNGRCMNAVTWLCSAEPVDKARIHSAASRYQLMQSQTFNRSPLVCRLPHSTPFWHMLNNVPDLIWHTPLTRLVLAATSFPRCTMAKHSSGVPSTAVRCLGREAPPVPLLMRARSTYENQHSCMVPVDLGDHAMV
jgi:hypothetical protein